MSETPLLLASTHHGDPRLSSELLPLVYDELRHLAASRLARIPHGQTLQPTALVHEAWLRLSSDKERSWDNRVHFFRAAALSMRRILVDITRAKTSGKRHHGSIRIDIADTDLPDASPDDRILLVNNALDRLATEDAESAQLVTLKFFGGYTNQEIARMNNVSERTVERQWAYAKSCLYTLIHEETPDITKPAE